MFDPPRADFPSCSCVHQMFRLEELVRRIDSDLHFHLTENGIQFTFFSFRWMNNLLMRGNIIRAAQTRLTQFHMHALLFALLTMTLSSVFPFCLLCLLRPSTRSCFPMVHALKPHVLIRSVPQSYRYKRSYVYGIHFYLRTMGSKTFMCMVSITTPSS